jgi:DNA-binding winged helix-turn-helix (wHTH) protein/TolB-like protein
MSYPRRQLFEFGSFQIDVNGRRLTRRGQQLALTPKAFDTLALLVQHAGATLTREEILDAVWHETAVEENNLNQQISILRKLLGDSPGEHRYIVTVPGIGYRFVAQVQPTEIRNEDSRRSRFVHALTRKWDLGHALALYFILVFALPVVIGGISGPTRRHQTVAILTFSAQSGDEAIGAGITNTLRARLGSVEDITLRPATSEIADPVIAGRDLRVETVLMGSVQREDERIRVTIEIVDVNGSRVVWGRTFDSDEGGVFEMQDRIAQDVVARLGARLISSRVLIGASQT